MKTLSDNYQISDRSYYFLLDWNDSEEKQTMNKLFGKNSVKSLTKSEFKTLLEIAMNEDIESIK